MKTVPKQIYEVEKQKKEDLIQYLKDNTYKCKECKAELFIFIKKSRSTINLQVVCGDCDTETIFGIRNSKHFNFVKEKNENR